MNMNKIVNLIVALLIVILGKCDNSYCISLHQRFF